MVKNFVRKIRALKTKLGKWFWIILIVVVAVLGVTLLRGGNKKGTASVKVEKGIVSQELVLTGSVNAEKYATLYFPSYGKIAWVGVKEGDRVKKGQALTSLDKTVLSATYQQALNNRRSTEAAVNNVHDQLKDNDKSESFSETATRVASEALNDNAWDALKAAKYNLDNATIIAPFAGVISSLPFSSPGVNVGITDAQVVIVDPATIYFDVNADQSEVTTVLDGQDVTIVLDSYSEKPVKGKVAFISYTPKPGEAGAVYKVKVAFDPTALGTVLPRIGMTGDAKFILSQKEGVLFVPPKFVNSDKDGKYVNLGKIGNKVRVEVGIEGEDSVEIISGVKEGDVLYD